jgi:hypothetical protein
VCQIEASGGEEDSGAETEEFKEFKRERSSQASSQALCKKKKADAKVSKNRQKSSSSVSAKDQVRTLSRQEEGA